MRLSRAVPLALALTLGPLVPAMAQFGGMPGMPGSPGMPGGSPFDAAPAQPPAECQQLLVYRNETQKAGDTLQAAGKKKAPPDELCKLFKVFLGSETKMVKGLEQHSRACGVPPEVIKQVKASHTKAEEMANKICEVAAQGARPAGPSLSEALGTTPTVPDASSKRGPGTFDTLEGSPLAR